MSNFIVSLPLRQKIILLLAIGLGLFLWYSTANDLIEQNKLNSFITYYGLGLPLLLLVFPTVIDLNKNRIFLVWFILSLILLCISFITKGSDRFLIHRSSSFEKTSGINSALADFSTSALKALFIFLIVYWLLNRLSKKLTGNFIVNTYWQSTWFNDDANREMTVTDVVCNIILFIIIILSALL
jgi:hypothetical protein